MAGIDDYLQGLDEQVVQEESKILVVRNPVVDVLLERYKLWMEESSKLEFLEQDYDFCSNLIKGMNYSAMDVRNFSVLFKVYENSDFFYWSGIFISALINTSKEKDFEIFTAHLSEEISHLGVHNKKNLTIMGDAGDFTGDNQERGRIIVKGSVGSNLGSHSKNGEIYVDGSIGNIDSSCKAKIYYKGELLWSR